MILYKLAMWMDERSRIIAMIEESDGDVRFLLHKKIQVEDRLRAFARRWLEGAPAQPVPSERMPETLRETDIPGLWVVEPLDDMELPARVL